MIRVLVVDDSAFMRKAIAMLLEEDASIEVAGTARNGRDAVKEAKRLKPDVITMDVEMPQMNGIEAVRAIMSEQPCPIIMVSSLTKEGARTTMEALEAGAVDVIAKPSLPSSRKLPELQEQLIEKVTSVVGARLFTKKRRAKPGARRRTPRTAVRPKSAPALVAIGTSTGGPFALRQILPELEEDFPVPIVIAQHMPAYFTRSLAARLDKLCPLEVVEAAPGMEVTTGRVVIARGGTHLTFRRERSGAVCVATPTKPDAAYWPSVDVLFESAVEVYGAGVFAVVMTGMGDDGVAGARRIIRAGGTVIVQSEESCAVYGMPRRVMEAGLAAGEVPLEGLSSAIDAAARSQHTQPVS